MMAKSRALSLKSFHGCGNEVVGRKGMWNFWQMSIRWKQILAAGKRNGIYKKIC